MPLFILLITTVLFTLVSFISNSSQTGISNSFVAFAATEGQFISDHVVACLLGFISLALFFIRSIEFDKSYSRVKNYSFAMVQVIGTIVTGFMLTYAVLLVIAFTQLNILAVLINTNPDMLGIQSNVRTINHILQGNAQAPQIIASDTDQYKELLGVADATTGTDTVYGKYILSSIPHFLVTPIQKPNSSILLIDNTLIITQISPFDMQVISPIVGYLFVKQYFPERRIKSFPRVTIMDRKQYQGYRGADAYVKIVKIDQEIKTIESTISTLSASVRNDKDLLAGSQNSVSQANTQGDAQYKNCLSDSNYTIDYCKNLQSKFDTTITLGSKDVSDESKKLQDDQSQLTNYQNYDKVFQIQKLLVQSSKGSIPFESGVFEPKDSIKIVFATNNSHAVADYFETVVHEYLHYTSYISDKHTLTDSFMEEGLTEYFARQTIKDTLNTSTNLGYPVFVKIMSQIAKTIPETELADYYFTKDEAGLEAALSRVYGDNFYQNNRLAFLTLQYTSSPQQAVSVANTIMKKIGGSPITEKDLMSSNSSL